MQDKTEKLIRLLYRKWSRGAHEGQESHPDEEDLACFLDGRLSEDEQERIKAHILHCDTCTEAVALSLEIDPPEAARLPEELLSRVKELGAAQSDAISVLEIILRLKEKVLEVINTTGDVLVGQELVPAPVLRSRAIRNFKDEINILKNFQDIRVEVKIEQRGRGIFGLTVVIKDKLSQKVVKDLRVTLIRDGVELESYIGDSGKVIFEHVLLGKYTVEICAVDSRLASILLEVKA